MEWRSFARSTPERHAAMLARAREKGHEVRTDVYVVWGDEPAVSRHNLKLRWGHAMELKTRLSRDAEGRELWSRAERIPLRKDSKPDVEMLKQLMRTSGDKQLEEAAAELHAAPQVHLVDVHKVRARKGWLEKTSLCITFEDGTSCYYSSHCLEGRLDKADAETAKLIQSGEILGGYNHFLLTVIKQHGKTKLMKEKL